jgi:DNA-directed RNA polymerase subunit RPC12/RpoP
MPDWKNPNLAKRQCPRCTSRSIVVDYDDDPRHIGAHAFLCLSCGRRFVPEKTTETVADQHATTS